MNKGEHKNIGSGKKYETAPKHGPFSIVSMQMWTITSQISRNLYLKPCNTATVVAVTAHSNMATNPWAHENMVLGNKHTHSNQMCS